MNLNRLTGRISVCVLCMACATPLVLVTGCPGTLPDGTDQPAGFTNANGITGGQMYDKFWATETGFDQNDPNIAILSANGDFFRCKQCHAWDHLANTASYIDRAPKAATLISAGRPNVTPVRLDDQIANDTPQELFDDIKFGNGARRSLNADLSMYDPADVATSAEGDQMPDFGEILTDAQIWDLVRYLKEEAFDTTQLYDITVQGVYPAGSRTFSNVGKDGDATNGNALYAAKCAGCHGADGTQIDLEGRSIGAFAREKPYEMWHKVKFGQLGSSMGPQGITTLADMKDMLRATANQENFPDLTAQ